MPPERTSRRQEPVSCGSCRKKKLRCDRSYPCMNCQTRAISCIYESRRNDPEEARATDPRDLQAENAAIKARLQLLEEAVFHGNKAATTPVAPSTSFCDGSLLGGASTGLRSPLHTQASSPETEQVRGYTDDSRWLEGVAAKGSAYLPLVLHDLRIEVEDLAKIAASISSGGRPAHILLPSLEQTMQLFQAYEEHVDALQHVIYIPTVRSAIEALYSFLRSSKPVVHSHLALLLAIVASISGFWALGSAGHNIYSSTTEAYSIATYWLRCGLDTLEYSFRTQPPDLEIVQSRIMILFLVYHLEGFSPMLRHFHAGAIANAKDLGLHVTDGAHSSIREDTQPQIIEAEMRRRVWWHLASTDWSVALMGGPHDGAYTVQPKHMQVRKPRNINDEDLATQGASFTRPASETTSTTYYLHRIRLGEACRDVADVIWDLNAVQDPEQIPYPEVLALDQKFADLLDGLPNISPLQVRLANEQDVSFAEPGPAQLTKQRYFTYLTVQARRCKLHLPFMLRAERDEQYKPSRDICLESARNILNLRSILPFEKPGKYAAVKLLGIMHHFFCAIVVLVMDLCVNKTAGDEQERKAEVRDACKILEGAKGSSKAATLFHESLMAILRKHKVHLHDEDSAQTAEHNGHGARGVGRCQPNAFMPALDDKLNFDDLWQSYFDFGSNPDPQSWDALFSDIDMNVP